MCCVVSAGERAAGEPNQSTAAGEWHSEGRSELCHQSDGEQVSTLLIRGHLCPILLIFLLQNLKAIHHFDKLEKLRVDYSVFHMQNSGVQTCRPACLFILKNVSSCLYANIVNNYRLRHWSTCENYWSRLQRVYTARFAISYASAVL